MQTKKTIIINQPIATVFNFVTDFRQTSHWWQGVEVSGLLELSAPNLPPIGIGLGYCYKSCWHLLEQRLEFSWQVVEFEPNQAITVKSISGALSILVQCRFEARSQQTSFSLQLNFETYRFFNPELLLTYLEEQIYHSLNTLKQLLETPLAKLAIENRSRSS